MSRRLSIERKFGDDSNIDYHSSEEWRDSRITVSHFKGYAFAIQE